MLIDILRDLLKVKYIIIIIISATPMIDSMK